MEYSIRRYTPELRDQVVELLAYLWSPHREVNDCAFVWKYERNPYVREPIVYVALCAGRVVALRGAYGVRWVMGREARPLNALGVGDMVVHPDHRNRGLYRRVDEMMIADLGACGWEYLFNTSLSRTARHVLGTAGWSTMPFVRPLAREGGSRLRRAVRRVVSRLSPPPDLQAPAVAPPDSHPPAGATALEGMLPRSGAAVLARHRSHVVSIAAEADVAALVAVAAASGTVSGVRHAKDAAYLTWRFHNPLCRYAYVRHETGGRADGFAVLHAHTDRSDPAVNVVDWEAADPGVLERMLRAVSRALPGVAVSIWPDGSRADMLAAMHAAGFAPIPDPPPQWTLPSFALRALGATLPAGRCDADAFVVDGKPLLALESWSLRMIASDFY